MSSKPKDSSATISVMATAAAARPPRILFTAGDDEVLLLETNSSPVNPFEFPGHWETVAKNFNDEKKLSIPISSRTCKERVRLLIKKWEKSEACSRKKSGINENYTDFERALIDVHEREREAKLNLAEKSKMNSTKKTSEKNHIDKQARAGKKVRHIAMVREEERARDIDGSESDNSETDEQPQSTTTRRAPKRKSDPWLEFLEKKLELEMKKEDRKAEELKERSKEREQMMAILAKAIGLNKNENEQ